MPRKFGILAAIAIVVIFVLSKRDSGREAGQADRGDPAAARPAPSVAPESARPGSSAGASEAGDQERRTFAKFETLYGRGGATPALFEWAILGQRLDRGSEDFAEKHRQTLEALERDPNGAFERLRAGQPKIPPEWGAMRNAMLNLAMKLDVPKAEKIEYLTGEIVRPVRLVAADGKASADSFAVTTAADYLSKIGTESDAQAILESYRENRAAYSREQIDFVLERVGVYFPDLVRRMRPEF